MPHQRRWPGRTQHLVAAGQPVPQVAAHPRGRHRHRTTHRCPAPAPRPSPSPRSSCPCLTVTRCHATAFSRSSPTSSCADPMCSISPNPPRRMHDLPPSAHGRHEDHPTVGQGPRFVHKIPTDPRVNALGSVAPRPAEPPDREPSQVSRSVISPGLRSRAHRRRSALTSGPRGNLRGRPRTDIRRALPRAGAAAPLSRKP